LLIVVHYRQQCSPTVAVLMPAVHKAALLKTALQQRLQCGRQQCITGSSAIRVAVLKTALPKILLRKTAVPTSAVL
jgi:hypothetical protein